jgi:hypothetical protein
LEADRAAERHGAGFAGAVHELDVEDRAGADAELGRRLVGDQQPLLGHVDRAGVGVEQARQCRAGGPAF